MLMDIMITDLPAAVEWAARDCCVIVADGSGSPCIGCFGCWTRTPGECVIHDGLEKTGPLYSHADRLILVSRCCFGSVSPFVKKVLDRSISYVHPYFEVREGTMHHKRRYSNKLHLEAVLYGPSTAAEQKTAEGILAANALNMDAVLGKVCFIPDEGTVREALGQ